MQSRVRGVGVIPNFHIQINTLVKWVVVIEPIVGALYTFHYVFYRSSLRIIRILGEQARGDAAPLISASIFSLKRVRPIRSSFTFSHWSRCFCHLSWTAFDVYCFGSPKLSVCHLSLRKEAFIISRVAADLAHKLACFQWKQLTLITSTLPFYLFIRAFM